MNLKIRRILTFSIALTISTFICTTIMQRAAISRTRETIYYMGKISLDRTSGTTAAAGQEETAPSVAAAASRAQQLLTTFLLIAIPVRPSSFSARELVRTTWYKGYSDSEDVMLRFVLGTKGLDSNLTMKLDQENSTHGDLVYFPDLEDSVSALTNKTLLMFKWANQNVNFSYLLKSDDDTFVYVNRTIAELRKRPTNTRLYYGIIKTRNKPQRSGAQWVDETWNMADTYLPFALGGGYFLSSDLISLLVGTSEYLQWYPNEDTAVGIWLAPYLIERRNDHLICLSMHLHPDKRCSKSFMIHLFYGMKKEILKNKFMQLSGLL